MQMCICVSVVLSSVLLFVLLLGACARVCAGGMGVGAGVGVWAFMCLSEGKHYWEVELLSEIGGELVDINCYLSRSLIVDTHCPLF